MKKICVTGGAGFVASHLVEHLARQYPRAEIVVVDKIGYASRLTYLHAAAANGQVRLVRGSVADLPLMRSTLNGVDLVVHAAAESHVDKSYADVGPFIESNVAGTVALLQAAIDNHVGLFFHISTDEVYGGSDGKVFTDDDRLGPTNPYAASKASAELFVNCYAKSYGLQTLMTRANNMFGPRQFPEKLIPKLICDAVRGTKFQVHGAGSARRSFLHVSDFCRAVSTILATGERNTIYNIPALRDYSVLDVVNIVCKAMKVEPETLIEFGPDRPHNDSSYDVAGDRIMGLGWRPLISLEDSIGEIVEWYVRNIHLFHDDAAEPVAPVVPTPVWQPVSFGQTNKPGVILAEFGRMVAKRPASLIEDTLGSTYRGG